MGMTTEGDTQLVCVDTPGFVQPTYVPDGGTVEGALLPTVCVCWGGGGKGPGAGGRGYGPYGAACAV
jgi:hypothetical protein